MEKVKVEFSGNSECDLSGENIKRKEPRIIFFRAYEIKLNKVENLSNIVKYCNKDTDIEKETGLTIEYERAEVSYCSICHNKKKDVFCFDKKDKGESARGLICYKCLNELSRLTKVIKENLDDISYYWDSSGFCVRKINETKTTLYGEEYNMNDSTRENDFIIEIGFKSPEYVKLDNVEKFKEDLEDIDRNKKSSVSCIICNNNRRGYKLNQNVRSKMICETCRKELLEGLSEFIEKESGFIMSKVI